MRTRLFSPVVRLMAVLFISGLAATNLTASERITILACPMGCGVLEGNTMLGTIMAKNNENLLISAQETPGYIFNIRAMMEKRRWKNQVFGTEDTIIQLALQTDRPELKEFIPKPSPIKFKLLHGEGYWSAGKFFITLDPTIKTIADMKGKRISLGLRGQSDWGVYPRLILKYGYGIDKTNSDIRTLNPPIITQQLLDGATDVGITSFGSDPDQKFYLISNFLRQLEASGKKIYYIPMDEEIITKINKQFQTTFVVVKTKAGTLPHQTSELVSGANRGYKAVHPNFPEELAYQFVMLVHKHAPEMTKYSKLWQLLTPKMMVDGLTKKNTHPGAIRAYKELGIWDLRKGSVPVSYPGD